MNTTGPGTGPGPVVRMQGDDDAPDAVALSPARRRFDGLMQRLERDRALLQAWNAALQRWHSRYAAQAVPLFERRAVLDRELLLQLDQAHAGCRLGKAELRLLSGHIAALAGPLAGRGDAAMDALLARHRQADVPDATAAQVAAGDAGLRQQLADHFGVSVEDLDAIEVPEALLARLRERERMQGEHARQRGEQRRAGKARRAVAPAGTMPDTAPAALPLRELYRKLVAALHPDREPDAGERARKTALMQRINQAYRGGNLLELIELQLEIGQVRPEQLLQMDDARIERYNHDLERQLAELGVELARVEAAFRADYGLEDAGRLAPDRLDALLAQLKRQLAAEIAWLEQDLRSVQDPVQFKRWLKQQRRFEAGTDDEGDG